MGEKPLDSTNAGGDVAAHFEHFETKIGHRRPDTRIQGDEWSCVVEILSRLHGDHGV